MGMSTCQWRRLEHLYFTLVKSKTAGKNHPHYPLIIVSTRQHRYWSQTHISRPRACIKYPNSPYHLHPSRVPHTRPLPQVFLVFPQIIRKNTHRNPPLAQYYSASSGDGGSVVPVAGEDVDPERLESLCSAGRWLVREHVDRCLLMPQRYPAPIRGV